MERYERKVIVKGCEWVWVVCVVFFFKQKTAYEMRISDWSSDVCSSDLPIRASALFGAGSGSGRRIMRSAPCCCAYERRPAQAEKAGPPVASASPDRKSTRLNSSH